MKLLYKKSGIVCETVRAIIQKMRLDRKLYGF